MWIALMGLLAVYGLATLVRQLWSRRTARRQACVPTVIVVGDQAGDWIEWFVRKLHLDLFMQCRQDPDVLIVDCGDLGETASIVTRLQRNYGFVTYIPSTPQRCWTDAVALLAAGRRSHALVVEIRCEADVRRALRMIAQLTV
jgi:hypothetical protein